MFKAADLTRGQSLRIERKGGRLEGRGAHGDTHQPVLFEFELDDALHGLGTDTFFIGQAFVIDKLYETTRTVSALLDFSAVGVKNTIFKISFLGLCGLDDQNLVGTDSEMPIGQEAQLLRR